MTARKPLCRLRESLINEIERGGWRGRWIVAAWDERGAQWKSSDLADPAATYCYSVGKTLGALAMLGIRTYPTAAKARAALRRFECCCDECCP